MHHSKAVFRITFELENRPDVYVCPRKVCSNLVGAVAQDGTTSVPLSYVCMYANVAVRAKNALKYSTVIY